MDEMDRMIATFNQRQDQLISRFTVLLNSKKARIRELEEQLKKKVPGHQDGGSLHGGHHDQDTLLHNGLQSNMLIKNPQNHLDADKD